MKGSLTLFLVFITLAIGCASKRGPANTFSNADAIIFSLPFGPSSEAVCTHAAGVGSHAYANAYYAIDLATDYSLPAATILASADGMAFVVGSSNSTMCKNPGGTARESEVSDCGNSWGNQVRILHADGLFSFYTHLEVVTVKSGERVRAGQPIGREGWTGAAGHRHLHWSVQKLPGGSEAEWKKQILTYDGESIPFRFTAIQDGKKKEFSSAELKCAHANIGAVPAAEQPRFRGLP